MKIQLLEDGTGEHIGFITTDGNAMPSKGEKLSFVNGTMLIVERFWHVPEVFEDANAHPTLVLK